MLEQKDKNNLGAPKRSNKLRNDQMSAEGMTPFAISVHSANSAQVLGPNTNSVANKQYQGVNSAKGQGLTKLARKGRSIMAAGPDFSVDSSTKKYLADHERRKSKNRYMAQPSYKSKIGDADSYQYQKLTIIDDFMDDVKINGQSSKVNTEADAPPEQRIYDVKPEHVTRPEIFSQNNHIATPSDRLSEAVMAPPEKLY